MRIARCLIRAFIGTLALLALIIAGLTIYLRTASFDQLLEREAGDALRGRFRGQITIGAIQTPHLGSLKLHDISITYQGRKLLYAPLAEVGYALIPLLWHRAELTITLDRPNVHITREAGQWDLVEALQTTAPSTSGASQYTVTFSALELSGGMIYLAPNGLSGPRYTGSAVTLDAQADLPPSGLKLNARRFSAQLDAPNTPRAEITLAASYDASSQPATFKLTSLRVTTQNSALSANATIINPSSPAIDAQVTLTKLSANDLSWIHGYPLRDDLAGSLSLNGPAKALRAAASLSAGPALASLSAVADISGSQLVFHGTLALTRLDLSRLVLGVKLAGQVETTAQIKGTSRQLSAIDAMVKAHCQGLVIDNLRPGDGDLVVETKHGRARLATTLNSGPSMITGNAALANFTAPEVRAQIVTHHLDLQTLTGSQMQPKSDINGTLALDASHIDPAKLDLAHLDVRTLLTLSRSSLQNIVITNSSIDARIQRGVAELARASVNAEDAALNTRGAIGLIPGAATHVSYSIHARHLGPLMQIAKLKGDGGLDLNGTANGILFGASSAGLHAQGRAAARDFTVSGISAARANAAYDLSRIGQLGLPLGRAQIHLGQLVSGTTRLRSLDATTRITRQYPAALVLALNVTDLHGNNHSAAASLVTQNGNVSGALTQLSVAAPDGVWHLATPAHFVAGPSDISIDKFDVRNGSREITLGGTMRIAGSQNVTFAARDLDLRVIQPLLQPNQHTYGTIAADIAITGTAAAPNFRASLTSHGLAINQQRIGDLIAHADYNPGAASVNLALYQDRTHQMTLGGTVPVALDWAQGFHAHLGNNVALRLYSTGLRLGGLAALAPPQTLKEAAGQLAFDLAISGPPLHPDATGTLTLNNISGEIVPLGITVNSSYAHMRITPALFTLEHLIINAGDGSITGAGSVALANYAPGAVDLTVRLHHFSAIHTERYQAAIGGELHVGGIPTAPDVTGRVEVLNAAIHPDLAFLSAIKYRHDDTIVVIRADEEKHPATAGANDTKDLRATDIGRAAASSSLFDSLVVNVAVVVHRDTWIRHPDATVELAGDLQAVKQRHRSLTLVGEIDTVRGSIVFNAQSFTLVSGQILFTGGDEIDPSLNLDAQYTVSDYTIDILVSGFASKPQIKLQSNPPLPQADILSLLLFGQSSSSLGQGQTAALQQQAAKIAAGAAASTIGRALSNSLGLQDLGIDLNGSAGNGGVGFGRYIGKNTYLAATQSTAGRKVSIQYYIRRWLSITTSTNSDDSSEIFLNLTRQY